MKLYYTGIRKMHFYLVYLACLSYFKPPYQDGYAALEDIICAVKKNQGKFGVLYDEKNTLYRFIKFYVSKPRLLFNLSNQIKKQKDLLFKKYEEKFTLKKLKTFNNNNLIKIYNEFFYLMRCLFYLNQVVWHLDISGNPFLENRWRNGKNRANEIRILTQPDKINYLQGEEIEFLKLCYKYFRKQGLLDINSLLEDHPKRFAYVGISYYNEPPKKKSDYLKIIKAMTNKGQGWRYVKRLLEKKEKNFKKQLKIRDKIYSKIRNHDINNTIILLREAVYLKDYFRGSISEIIYRYFNALLYELARRLKLSTFQIKGLTDDEIKRLVKGKQINWQEVGQRKKYYVMGTLSHKFFLDYGKKARVIEHRYFSHLVTEKINELKGVSAQKGIARGKVKIILSFGDFKKFKQGDILVASNTMPEYMPIIKRAKAIITEVGGITCHAAIVSRELKIPCIIGTKIATQVLKDGDLVEVDAERGMVRRISK